MVSSAPDAWAGRAVTFQSNRVSPTPSLAIAGKRNSEPRDNSAKIACSVSIGLRGDRNAERQSPPIRGLFASLQEISASARVRGGAGRIRTSNQTVMSGLADLGSSDNSDIFRHVRCRLFTSVHGVSVVNLWSVHPFPRRSVDGQARPREYRQAPGNRPTRLPSRSRDVARLVQLTGTRAGGFVLTRQEPAGKQAYGS